MPRKNQKRAARSSGEEVLAKTDQDLAARESNVSGWNDQLDRMVETARYHVDGK